jgi:hypothetical protein
MLYGKTEVDCDHFVLIVATGNKKALNGDYKPKYDLCIFLLLKKMANEFICCERRCI